jgi:hypothetical protein
MGLKWMKYKNVKVYNQILREKIKIIVRRILLFLN